jgi:hypothetical protein
MKLNNNICTYCYLPGRITCESCNAVNYCTEEHKKIDWPNHIYFCKIPVQCENNCGMMIYIRHESECPDCKRVYYCSNNCYRANYDEHQRTCEKITYNVRRPVLLTPGAQKRQKDRMENIKKTAKGLMYNFFQFYDEDIERYVTLRFDELFENIISTNYNPIRGTYDPILILIDIYNSNDDVYYTYNSNEYMLLRDQLRDYISRWIRYEIQGFETLFYQIVHDRLNLIDVPMTPEMLSRIITDNKERLQDIIRMRNEEQLRIHNLGISDDRDKLEELDDRDKLKELDFNKIRNDIARWIKYKNLKI